MSIERTAMTTGEALAAISSGHAIYTVAGAQEMCTALSVPWNPELVQVYESERHPMGVQMFNGPSDGVWSLGLARHCATALGVESKAQTFHGRGSQAREYARVVGEALGVAASE